MNNCCSRCLSVGHSGHENTQVILGVCVFDKAEVVCAIFRFAAFKHAPSSLRTLLASLTLDKTHTIKLTSYLYKH